MDKVHRTLTTLIKDQCANFCKDNNGILNSCVPSDSACKYFINNKKLARCSYLEEGVFASESNNQARTLYYATLEAERYGEKINNRSAAKILKVAVASREIECERCKRAFKPSNNRQMYCEICSKIIRREKTRQRVKRLREKDMSVTF